MIGAVAVTMISLALDVAVSKLTTKQNSATEYLLLLGIFFLINKSNVVEKPLPGLLVLEHWYLWA